ncbi:hypothetical protein VR45_34950, partial [Streptomyces sp. NRRL S-495]
GLVEELAAAEAAVLEQQAEEESKEASKLADLEPQQEKAQEPSQRARAGRGREVGAQMLQDAVEAALEAKGGDIEAATAVLVKRAIQDGMALLKATRIAGRYEYTAYPAAPEILQKKVKGGADQIWESRPKWVNKSLTPEQREMPVHALALTAHSSRRSRPIFRSALSST